VEWTAELWFANEPTQQVVVTDAPVRMIRVLITRILTPVSVTFPLSVYYSRLGGMTPPLEGCFPPQGANGTWVTLYYQDMGYSLCCRVAGFLPPGNA
jgi:hypothetical protein